jgi:hypothetical protein
MVLQTSFKLVSLKAFDDRPVRTVYGVVGLDQLITDLSNRPPTVNGQCATTLIVVVKRYRRTLRKRSVVDNTVGRGPM